MNTPKDPIADEAQPLVNEQRRRLTRGGLAAPVVLGALLSRPVLGAAPHKCTISGQLSGNTSTHDQSIDCHTLGTKIASDWIALWRSWPGTNNDFYITNAGRKPFAYAREFGNTPNSLIQFVQAYKATPTPASGKPLRNATVLEVLLGYVPTYDITAGTYTPVADANYTLTEVKPLRASLTLGQEAIVTYLNAINNAPNFPLSKGEVVTMFNDIYTKGSYAIASGSKTGIWYPADVLQYFQGLHS